jgi:hypothetical protein
MVKPVNGQQYNTFILGQYFDVVVDGAAAADDITLEAITAIDLIPEKVTLADKAIVEAARAAYAKISVNEQKALVKNYQKLEAAEKQIAKLEYLENEEPTTPDVPDVDPIVNDGLPTVAIVFIVIGSVLVLAAAGAGVYFFVLRDKLKKSKDGDCECDSADEPEAEEPAEINCNEIQNSEETSEDNNN